MVLELAEQGLAFGDILALTPELAFRFCTYWSIVAHRRTQAPDVRYPFYHLKSDGFWSPLGEDGKPAPDRRLVRYASLPLDFVAFARDPACRDQARRILIAKYFQPAERAAPYDLVGLPIPSADQIARDAAYQSPDEVARQGRMPPTVAHSPDTTTALRKPGQPVTIRGHDPQPLRSGCTLHR